MLHLIKNYLLKRRPMKFSHKRTQAVGFQFGFHVEEIAIKQTFEEFCEVLLAVKKVMGHKALCCVTTPLCEQTQFQMQWAGSSEEQYIERLKKLSEIAVIGYHGHFFVPGVSKEEAQQKNNGLFGGDFRPPGRQASPEDWARISEERQEYLLPWSGEEEHLEFVKNKMIAEIDWLTEQGFAPRHYIAGWWHLHPAMIEVLEAKGFLFDLSYREGHKNSFGQWPYSDMPQVPRGEVGVLKNNFREIHSIFYPVGDPRNTRESWKKLAHLPEEQRQLVVFPAHESEILDFNGEWERHLKFILDTPAFEFFDWETIS